MKLLERCICLSRRFINIDAFTCSFINLAPNRKMCYTHLSREITPKVCNTEFMFLRSAPHLMMLYFMKTSEMAFTLQSGHDCFTNFTVFNWQRAITPKHVIFGSGELKSLRFLILFSVPVFKIITVLGGVYVYQAKISKQHLLKLFVRKYESSHEISRLCKYK